MDGWICCTARTSRSRLWTLRNDASRVCACLPAAQVWARYRVNQVKLMRALAWTAVSLVLFTIPSTVDPAGYW